MLKSHFYRKNLKTINALPLPWLLKIPENQGLVTSRRTALHPIRRNLGSQLPSTFIVSSEISTSELEATAMEVVREPDVEEATVTSFECLKEPYVGHNRAPIDLHQRLTDFFDAISTIEPR